MDSDRTPGQGVREQATTLTQVLSGLKRRGSTLLLAGPPQRGAVSTACRRLLGDRSGTRRRLFVLTGDSVADHHGVEALSGPEREAAQVVSYATRTRSAAAAAAPDDATPDGPGIDAELPTGVPTRSVEGGLGDLLAAVADAAAELDDQADGLEPSELRVCLDSLDSLLATHDEEAVFRFLHLLSGIVRDHRAMCHVHLPAEVESRAVALLEPTCDAVVEVRDVGGPQQRWHVPDAELETDWLLL